MSILPYGNTAVKNTSMPEDIKEDNGKLRFDLILPEFEEDMAAVLTMGAQKYEPNSWQKIKDAKNRYYAALRRHLAAWRKGEKVDPESNISHLAHVACNVMFLMYFESGEDSNGK